MIKNRKKYFENYVLNYEPFEWENKDFDDRPGFKNKNSFLISYKRFYKVFSYILDIEHKFSNTIKVMDVGAWPGNMIKLIKDLFKDRLSECAAIRIALLTKIYL